MILQLFCFVEIGSKKEICIFVNKEIHTYGKGKLWQGYYSR